MPQMLHHVWSLVMPQRYLIDGDNLLHALGLPKRLGPGGLQRARQHLLAFIRRRCPAAECTVVFDGTQASPPSDENGVSVLFAKGEADDLIREFVMRDSAPKGLCVVSSDRALQSAAKRRHAQVMSVEAFLDVRPKERSAVALPPEKPPIDVDLEQWLQVFEDIDSDPVLRKMQAVEPLRSGKKKRK